MFATILPCANVPVEPFTFEKVTAVFTLALPKPWPFAVGIPLAFPAKFVASNKSAFAVTFLVIMLNDLSVFLLPAVALKVKLVVVSPDTAAAVPEITPVVPFKENPAPVKLLDVSE